MHQRALVGAAVVSCLLGLGTSPALGGPDVTHQEIQDALKNPSTGGPINGKYGYAWGSYTCNLGDTALAWLSGGTPALAMNAYRLYDGRLMQIGLGNAKHACCVGNGAGCGTCSTVGTGLRPGCRDTYSASFNSGQSRLGPRSGINPYAATFTSIPSGTGDALWRRVQIDVGDMNAANFPGALYFAEGVYVCAAEQPAQQLNNATYRPMNVANAGAAPTYVWSITSTTRSGSPAITAWRDHGGGLNIPDSSVKIDTIDVPGEGRYFIGAKVIDLGGGQWRYEYAVFNLNSHQSAGALRIPMHPSVNVSAIGFHAPDYHSGEVYSNADWVALRCGSSMGWNSPQTFAQNPNANALRWGTMYNFWFTANQPPVDSEGASIALFRPGTESSVAIPRMPIPSVAACVADFNAVAGVTTQDLFDFLNAWYTEDGRADMNCNGGVSVQDVFDYITAWFSAC